MPTPLLIAVADATGLLGGAVARAIANDPQHRFRLRALVQPSHANAPAARALAAAGAEVVAVTHDDATELLRGVGGAHGVFAVTDFWDHGSPERELSQARAMSTAARLADVEHVIWSTQEDSRCWLPLGDARMPTLLQRYKVPSFDAKGEADLFFAASGIPTTFLRSALAWEQLLGFGLGPRRGEDGALRLALPIGQRPVAGIALADVGACVRQLFVQGPPEATRMVGIAGEHLTGAEMAAFYRRALGESVLFEAVPFDSWRALGLPGAEELGNMFQFMHDFSAIVNAQRPVASTRQLHPELLSFGQWLTIHRSHIPSV
jgi:uncharacterized protein YbjT (DUF2867 family)